jgi:hypothetical protein
VVGIGQDITGRIAQEREYSKLIDSANAPIFGVDTLGVSKLYSIVSLFIPRTALTCTIAPERVNVWNIW